MHNNSLKKRERAPIIVECAYFVQPTIIRLKKLNLYIQETTGRKVISQRTNQEAKGNTEGADHRTDVSTGQAYSTELSFLEERQAL